MSDIGYYVDEVSEAYNGLKKKKGVVKLKGE